MGAGGAEKQVTDLEFMEAAVLLPGPATSTGEFASHVGMTQQGAYDRLDSLRHDGLLESKLSGGSRLWWPTLAGEKFVANRLLDGYEDS